MLLLFDEFCVLLLGHALQLLGVDHHLMGVAHEGGIGLLAFPAGLAFLLSDLK